MPLGAVLPDTRIAIDTDILTGWRFGRHWVTRKIDEYIARHSAPPAITATTVFEACWGFYKEARGTGEMGLRLRTDFDRIRELMDRCVTLSIDEVAADLAASICATLKITPKNKLMRDISICATAISKGYGIATGNKKDFELIAKNVPQDCIVRLEFWKP